MPCKITAPYPANVASECAFNTSLPSVDCPKPGLFIERLLVFVHLVFNDSCRTRIIEASRWQFYPTSRLINQSDDSTMGLVESGRADMTDVGMYLTYDRVQRFSRHTLPIMSQPYLMMYRRYGRSQIKSLTFIQLMYQPSGIWFAIAAIFTLKLIGKQIVDPLIPDRKCGGLKRETNNKNVKTAMRKLYKRWSIIMWVLVGVIFSVLSNYICILFSIPQTTKLPIRTLDDLIDSMVAGRYTLVSHSQVFIDSVMRESLIGKKKLSTVLANNPPRILLQSEIRDYLVKDKENRWPNHVYIGTTVSDFVMNINTEMPCNARLYTVELKELGVKETVAFYRAGFDVPTTPIKLHVLRTEYSRLSEDHFDRWTRCGGLNQSEDSNQLGNIDGFDDGLSFSRLTGVFLLCLAGFICCLSSLLLELASVHLTNSLNHIRKKMSNFNKKEFVMSNFTL